MTDWLEELLALAGEADEQGEPLRLLTRMGAAPIPVFARGETSPAAAVEEQDLRTGLLRENGMAPPRGGRTAETGIAGAEVGARREGGAALPDPEKNLDLSWLFQGGAETVGAALKMGRTGREPLSGLEGLYRRATETALAPAAVPAAPTGQSVLREEVPAAGLTAEELDRTVRRDSRRYDGAMSIY